MGFINQLSYLGGPHIVGSEEVLSTFSCDPAVAAVATPAPANAAPVPEPETKSAMAKGALAMVPGYQQPLGISGHRGTVPY